MVSSLLRLGLLDAVIVHAADALALHRRDTHARLPAFYGQDPAASCNDWAGLSLWCLGYPEDALARIRAGLDLAGEPGREYGLANAHMHAARLRHLRREPAEALTHAEATVSLARAH